jgi:hypothetical protein
MRAELAGPPAHHARGKRAIMASTNQQPPKVSDREHSKEVPEDAATPPIRDRMQTTTKDKPKGSNKGADEKERG